MKKYCERGPERKKETNKQKKYSEAIFWKNASKIERKEKIEWRYTVKERKKERMTRLSVEIY